MLIVFLAISFERWIKLRFLWSRGTVTVDSFIGWRAIEK